MVIEETDTFWAGPDGDLLKVTARRDRPPRVPDGYVQVTEEEYNMRLAEIEVTRAELFGVHAAEVTARRQSAGMALVALGLSAEQASVLSGIPADRLDGIGADQADA